MSEAELAKAEEYWQRMVNEGGIDRFNKKEGVARKEAERYVDLDTVEHTDAREVDAEWLCKQAIDQLRIEEFLHSEGWSDNGKH